MPLVARFVDSITAGRTVRLNLNDGKTWRLLDTSRFPSPGRKQARVSTLMTDGAQYPHSAYDDRVLELRWVLQAASTDLVAAELQRLARELDRPSNIFEYELPGATHPVFFLTHRLGLDAADMPTDGTLMDVEVVVRAQPFAYGLKETLPSVKIHNDPYEGVNQLANSFFEIGVASWNKAGGTFVHSTAQAHEGTGSGLLTPDGVSAMVEISSESVSAAPDAAYGAAVWVRCAQTRTFLVGFNWRTAADANISNSVSSAINVTANTWMLLEHAAVSTAATGKIKFLLQMTGTPPAGHTTHVDEALLWRAGTAGALCADITGVIGDVATPLQIRIPVTSLDLPSIRSAVAVRRGGTPSEFRHVHELEDFDPDTDTSVQTGDTAMSGNSFMRTTFATSTTMVIRLSEIALLDAGVVNRGSYKLFLRYRKSVAGDVIRVQTRYGGTSSTAQYDGPVVTLASTTDIRFAELGRISLPLGRDPVYDGYGGAELQVLPINLFLLAERFSGSGNLDWDVLLLIPADDQYTLVSWNSPVGFSTGHWVLDGPVDAAWLRDLSTGGVAPSGPVGVAGAGSILVSPAVTNRLYFVQNAGSTFGSDLKGSSRVLELAYWPRYLTVRPPST